MEIVVQPFGVLLGIAIGGIFSGLGFALGGLLITHYIEPRIKRWKQRRKLK